MNFPFEAFCENFADGGADGWDEKKEADGVGEETGRDEDGSGEEDHESVEGFGGGKAAFSGGLLEFGEGFAALGFRQGSPEDGGRYDDDDGVREPKFPAEGHKEVELGQRDEDEEEKQFSEHNYALKLGGERIFAMRKAGGFWKGCLRSGGEVEADEFPGGGGVGGVAPEGGGGGAIAVVDGAIGLGGGPLVEVG